MAYLDKILNFWEHKSAQIKTFECKFTRWDYDPSMIRDPNTARSISRGEIRYSTPDKGLFKVNEVLPAKFPKGTAGQATRPTYDIDPYAHGLHWICDGVKTYEFDYGNKQLNVQSLPESMKGSGE